MQNLRLYEAFSNGDPEEKALEEIIGDPDFQEEIKGHLRRRGLDVSEIEVIDDESFFIYYASTAYDGAIPNRISMYLDDLGTIITEEIGVVVDWRFDANGNCQKVYYTLSKSLDLKYLKARRFTKVY